MRCIRRYIRSNDRVADSLLYGSEQKEVSAVGLRAPTARRAAAELRGVDVGPVGGEVAQASQVLLPGAGHGGVHVRVLLPDSGHEKMVFG